MNVLIIHQSTEMYGSDKSILGLIKYGLSSDDISFLVYLPDSIGPLYAELMKLNEIYPARLEINVAPVVKISKSIISIKGLSSFLFENVKGVYFLFKNRNRLANIDLVHSNTVAVLLGFWLKLFFRKKHIWNVREIIDSPKLLSVFFQKLVKTTSDLVISNSYQTNEWIRGNNDSSAYTYVDNGVEAIDSKNTSLPESFNSFIEINNNPTIITLVGRISRWKGQKAATQALVQLRNKGINAVLVLVGDCHNSSLELLDELKEHILRENLTEQVYFSGYIADPAPFYNISDIILVPSEKPEPFGRVAVEAMSCSKLVIASNHGGLASIIDNDENGILFEPNDLHDLVKALTKAIEEKSHCSELAKNGYKKYLSQYTSEICYKKYLKYYERFNCFRN